MWSVVAAALMSRLISIKTLISSGFLRVALCWLAAFLLLASLSVQGQQAPESCSISGTVRDAKGPVADATLRLTSKDDDRIYEARTNSQGRYQFSVLHAGVFMLHAEAAGYSQLDLSPFFVSRDESKSVDVTLQPAQSASAPQFYDEPQFNVAGVTDTTSLGGHGSDVIVRTRDKLAKDTASLSNAPGPQPLPPEPRSEKPLRDLLSRDPSSFEANHQLGELLLRQGKDRDALIYLDRAAKVKPDDYQNAYDQALANANAGNYDHARTTLNKLIATRDKAELHHLLADVDEKSGDPLEAVLQYQRAAELDPSEPYFFDWGSELLLHHAPEPALQVFTKGNHLFPRSERILIGLGAAWFAQGSYARAVQRICDASDLNPSDPAPYLFLGRMQHVENTFDPQVREKLRRFVTLQPNNPDANYYYSVALWKSRKDPNSKPDPDIEKFLSNAVRLNPRFAPAYLQLGILHSETGDFPRAASDYEAALKLDPQLEEGHYRLAQAYRQLGKPELAKEELRLYNECVKESEKRVDEERHQIRQFVYTLRDQPSAQPQ